MSEPVPAVQAEDRTWRALGIALLGTVGAYAVVALLLMALLWAIFGQLPRDSFWGRVAFMLVFMLPQVSAPWIGIKVANLLSRPYRRRFVYWVFCGLILVAFVAFTVGYLQGGEWRGFLLTGLQAVTSFLAWRLARHALGIGRPAGPPPAVR